MKSCSGDPGPPIKGDNLQDTDSSDDDDVHMESSNSDFDCLRRLAFLSVMDNDNGGERGSDVVDKVPERRNVGFSRKRGRIQEDVVGGSNQEDLEVPELVIDDHFQRNIRFKRKKRYMRVKDKQILKWEVWEEEDEKWVEWNMMLDTDLDNQNDAVAEIAEPPSDFIIPLLKYQKEFLAWALKQEESDAKGGILADEMGMGKTAQAIALVLAKRELDRAACEPNGGLLSPSSSAGLPKIKATLVICPVGAMTQWNNEIDRFTSEGSNKVQVYHGANRGKTLHEILEYDFVITTYSTVLAEYRKKGRSLKKECERCGKFLDEHKIINHLRYYCQSDAKRTSKQKSKQNTSNKGKASESEADNFALHSVKWNRIILDEAHYIKDRHSDTTKAVLALESSYRWALSGTPLQNRVGELYSLIRFLQITPFSYYFCKECDCRRLDHSYNCPNCPHRSVKHFCWWNLFVTAPIAKGNSEEIRKTMILLKHKFLKRILLRRTKKRRVTDLALPPKLVVLRRESLDFEEEDYYNSLYNASRAQFDTYVVDGTLTKNYAHLFGLLMRLRQAVNHPYLVEYSKSGTGKTSSMVNDSSGDQECGLCHDSVEDPVVTSCGHVYCKPCLRDICGSVEQDSCPSCSKPFTVDVNINKNYEDQNTRATVKGFKRSSILNQMQLDKFKSSTKIDALREEIRLMIERDGSAKGIVFSQFTAFLDLISYSLQKSGVNCVQLDGSMSIVARDAAIRRFTEDPDCKIFLLSLKAGGVALNLTVASNVFLMDPWWNPAVERQAQDRIHRIGQYKPVRIVRFIMEGTIEERILKLQERKELLFEGAISGSSDALGKLTADDLRYLFVN